MHAEQWMIGFQPKVCVRLGRAEQGLAIGWLGFPHHYWGSPINQRSYRPSVVSWLTTIADLLAAVGGVSQRVELRRLTSHSQPSGELADVPIPSRQDGHHRLTACR